MFRPETPGSMNGVIQPELFSLDVKALFCPSRFNACTGLLLAAFHKTDAMVTNIIDRRIINGTVKCHHVLRKIKSRLLLTFLWCSAEHKLCREIDTCENVVRTNNSSR